MSNLKPFFINSNICLNQCDIQSPEKFFSVIAGNTGNSYITYALIKTLFGGLININHIPNIYEYDFAQMDKDIDLINNECSHVFLILQDQIRIHESYSLLLPYDNIIQFIKRLNKPIIIAGLGANSFNGFDTNFHKKISIELIRFLQQLSEYCINIGVRGHFTEEVLHHIGVKNVSVIGCPSFFETGRKRVIEKKTSILAKDILLSSHVHNKYSLDFPCIMQDRMEESLIRAVAFADFYHDYTYEQINRVLQRKYFVFSSIHDWKKIISNYKFVFGYRLHGSIVSINAGVPAVCCNGDSRATEMCQYLKIPHNPNIGVDTNIYDVYDNIDIDSMNRIYPHLYDNYVNFFMKNNIYIEGELVNNGLNQYISQPSLDLYNKNTTNYFWFLDKYMSLNHKLDIYEQTMREQCIQLSEIKGLIKEQNYYLNLNAKYPKWLINLMCLFVFKKENRAHIRKKYSRT